MTKRNFRIKLDGDKRAVSYRNIEVNVDAIFDYKVTPKGVRTMVRQYLKSINKKIYEYPISFKYYKKSNGLDVKFDGISGNEIRELLPKLEQFTSGNVFRDVTENYKITFDLKSLVIFNGTPNTKSTNTPAPAPAPQTSGGLPKATKIKIVWHEGTGAFDNTTFATWFDLQKALEKIYDNWSSNPYGYDKVKVEIEWENGKKLLDRIDVGDDFKPYQNFIGDYLKEQNGAMYSSNFDKRPSPDDRDSVSWTDEVDEDAPSEAKVKVPLDEIIIKNIRENTSTGFKTWNDADIYLEEQWNQMPEDAKWQYNIRVYWKNNEVISKLITLGKAYDEYDVPNEYLGIYLYNIEINETWDEKKDNLQWDDDDVVQSEQQPANQPEQPEQQPMETNKLPLSYIEVYDIKKTKLLKRFTNWTDADNYFESIWLKLKPKTFKDYVVEIDWGSTQVRANTSIRLDAEEYYPDGNDGFYDIFLVNEFYNYKDTDKWKNVRDTLQWTDSEEIPDATPQSKPDEQPDEQPDNQPDNQPQQPNMKHNYILNKYQMQEIYGLNWREDLDYIEELDIYLGDELFQDSIDILKSGENLPLEVDDLGTFDITIKATTLACYHDYNDYSAEEIQEIIDGLIVFCDLKDGTMTDTQEAHTLIELLKLFKNINK